MSASRDPPDARARGGHGDPHPLVAGLEAVIDATAGILAAQSLPETLRAMADALASIVPHTSLAVFEVDREAGVGVGILSTGRDAVETLAARPPLDASLIGRAVRTRAIVHHPPGAPVEGTYVAPGTRRAELESIVVIPLLLDGRVEGALIVGREDPTGAGRAEEIRFAPEELMLLERFASLAAIAYAHSTQRERLRAQALTDALTGLHNRRHCADSLQAMLGDGRRRGEPTSLAYLDIDAFKAINDTYGHPRGDEVLREFADVLRTECRAGDVVCRTGGEEFTVLLPRTGAAEAAGLAERIAGVVRDARLGPRGTLTVSVGVATSPRSAEEVEWLVQRADGALLAAKRGGRDRVVAASMDP